MGTKRNGKAIKRIDHPIQTPIDHVANEQRIAELCKIMSKSQLVWWLDRAFLHAAAWGTPDYKKLPAHERKEFADIVKTGDLFLLVENFKQACLRSGISLTDDILTEICFMHVNSSSPLPEPTRHQLRRCCDRLHATLHRARAADASSGKEKLMTAPRPKNDWANNYFDCNVKTFAKMLATKRYPFRQVGKWIEFEFEKLPVEIQEKLKLELMSPNRGK
jgi:hypothetical protein